MVMGNEEATEESNFMW